MQTKVFDIVNVNDQSGGMMSGVSDDLMPDSACRMSLNLRYHTKRGAAVLREGFESLLYGNTYSLSPDAGMANHPCQGLGFFRSWNGVRNEVFGAWNGKTYVNPGPAGFSNTTIGAHASTTDRVRYVDFVNRIFRVGGGSDLESWDGNPANVFDDTNCLNAPRAELAARFKSRLILGRLPGKSAVTTHLHAVPSPTLATTLASPISPEGSATPVPGSGVLYTNSMGGSASVYIHSGTFASILVGATIAGNNPANPSATFSVSVLNVVSPTEILVSASIDIPYGVSVWTYQNPPATAIDIVLVNELFAGPAGNVWVGTDYVAYTGIDLPNSKLTGCTGVTQYWPAGTLVRTYDSFVTCHDTSDLAESGTVTVGTDTVTYTHNNKATNTLEGGSGFSAAWPMNTPVTQAAIVARPSSIYRSSIPDTNGDISWDPVATDAGEIIINPDDGDDIRALVSVGGQLLVMKSRATYRWNGTSTDPEPIINDGAVSQEAVVLVRDVAYWFGRKAFYAGNGGTPVEISQYIQDWVDAITNSGIQDKNIVAFTDGHTAWWYFGSVVKDGRTFTNCCLEYDPDTTTWAAHSLAKPVTAAAAIYLEDTLVCPGGRPAIAIEDSLGQGYFMFEGFDDNGAAINFERGSRQMWFDSPETTKLIEEMAWTLTGSASAKFSAAVDGGKFVDVPGKSIDAMNQCVNLKITGKKMEFRIAGSAGNRVEWRGFSIIKAKSIGLS